MTNALLFLDSPFNTMKLRQALDASRRASTITVARDILDLKDQVKTETKYDIIFLRAPISSKWLNDLITTLREEPSLQGASIIVITSGVEKSEFSFAQNLLSKGRIDAVLLEPFSVENLIEVIDIAKRAPRTLTDATMRKILRMLVKEICDQLTDIARLLRNRKSANISRAVFKDTLSIVNELPEQYQILFHEYLTERCEKAKPAQVRTKKIPSAQFNQKIASKQPIYRATKTVTIR